MNMAWLKGVIAMNNASLLQPAVLAVALALAGCASTSSLPKLDLPASASSTAPAALDAWWQGFNDPALTQLVDEALAHNVDVLTAAERVGQSQSTLREAQLALLPDVNLTTSATRRKPSGETAAAGQAGTRTTYDGGVSASYEIDLFGRLWKAQDAARQQLAASAYARETTRSAVAAQTARSYFALLALDSDVSLLEKTLATRDEALTLQQARVKVGAAGDYELKLAEAERASVAATLPKLAAARTLAEAALAVLLGRSPKDVIDGNVTRGKALDVLAQVPAVPLNLPTDLLTRRPDIQQAAAQYSAADASLGEARRRYFPSISLSGFLGGESLSFGKVLTAPARTWNAGAALVQPIIGLASIDAQVDIAKANRNVAELAYAQAARSAYADAKSALASETASRDTLNATQTRASAQERVSQLTALRYKAGAASYLDQLNAERDRLSSERDRIDALRDRLTALVSVYQALGGGWSGSIDSTAVQQAKAN
jgi:multidrug efflux system outer membrane protein